MLAILIFRIFAKMAKHEFASISLTVRDRAISSKFSTHRVSKECNVCNFQKKFPLPKNGGHFEFLNWQMKQGLVRLLYNFGKRFMGWTLHMIMCVLLCYPVSIHMSQLLSTGRPISSLFLFSNVNLFQTSVLYSE